jgi:hypothetical protein
LQEFDVEPTRTVREEFFSVYKQQQKLVEEQEWLSKELEECGEDMTRMQVGGAVCRHRQCILHPTVQQAVGKGKSNH